MLPEVAIKNRIDDKGLKLRYVSEKTKISSDKLSRSLKGKRKLKPEEFIALCVFLGMKVEDFNQNCKS